MRETWVGGIRTSGETFSPKFPLNIWNQNSTLIQDNPKTASALEAWHKTLNAELKKRKAHNYWSLVSFEMNCSLSKNRYLRLFSAFNRGAQRRPMLYGIPVLQRAVNEFDVNQENMSLTRMTEAAYSKRWNQPTSVQNGEPFPISNNQQQLVNLNVPGINSNLARQKIRYFNAPAFQEMFQGLREVVDSIKSEYEDRY